MKKLLKKLSLTAVLSLTLASVYAQDPDAFLHVQFENNLNASTTEAAGISFEVSDPDIAINYNSSNTKEGSYAIDFSSYTESDDNSLIDNTSSVQIESTTKFAITGSNARTFAAWIRFDDINSDTDGSYCIMNMGDPSSSSQGRVTWSFAAANDRIQIAVGGGNVNSNYDTSSNSNLEDGNWHHVAFTYAAGATLDAIIFYIDGEAVTNNGGSNSDSVGFNTDEDLVYIATRGNNSQKWFDGGGIDDLRVYDEVLTAEEILLIYGGTYLNIGDVAFEEHELKAYPNAVEDFLNIKTTSNSALNISVFDITGKAIIRTYGNSVDMSGLTSGLYIVKVREDNKVANLKILKK